MSTCSNSGIQNPPPTPPLPPPPPPPPVQKYDHFQKRVFLPKQVDPNEELPSPKKELSELCKHMWITLSGLNRVKLLAHYNQIKPVLQDGPTCGLVALEMAQALCKEEGTIITAEKLLNEAQKLGFSNSGEMFSAQNMLTIAQRVANCAGEVVQWSNERLLAHLVRGHPALVAYDADFNHEPCLKNGFSAHWCVLMGCIWSVDESFPFGNHSIAQDESFEHLHHYEDSQTRLTELITNIYNPFNGGAEVFVTARHGKSRFLAIWPLARLEESNKNLRELAPKHSEDNFVIPAGGLIEGLNNKMILLNPII